MKRQLKEIYRLFHDTFSAGKSLKEKYELKFWQKKYNQGSLDNNSYYQEFYTDIFDVDYDYYREKVILDIGCGPRGSLEWANNTTERYGLDPLAEDYLKLGADKHKMKYVSAEAENIPFQDQHFDIVASFNSLDHVDNADKAIKEIHRILKPNGLFLLIVDIFPHRTIEEPSPFDWNFLNKYDLLFENVGSKALEKKSNGVYSSIKEQIPFDFNLKEERYGILLAKLKRK